MKGADDTGNLGKLHLYSCLIHQQNIQYGLYLKEAPYYLKKAPQTFKLKAL